MNLKKEINTDLRTLKVYVMHMKSALLSLDEAIDNLYYTVNGLSFDATNFVPNDYFKSLSEDLK